MLLKFVSVFLLLHLLHKATSTTVSIDDVPQYSSQRPCAISCFYLGAFKGPDALAMAIGCDPETITNECLCRSDLQDNADTALRHCVSSKCGSNSLDIGSATSIYDNYCTSAGFNRAETPTTTSGEDFSPTATVTVTTIQTIFISSGNRQLQAPFQQLGQIARLRL
jgi:hypothetical protein